MVEEESVRMYEQPPYGNVNKTNIVVHCERYKLRSDYYTLYSAINKIFINMLYCLYIWNIPSTTFPKLMPLA